MPRKKYVEDGSNVYTPSLVKPPRRNEKKHRKILDDPVLKKEKNLEKQDMKITCDEESIKKEAYLFLKYGTTLRSQDFINFVTKCPDDLKQYVAQEYPKVRFGSFLSWVLEFYNRHPNYLNISIVRPVMEKIRDIFGDSYIRKHLDDKNLRYLGF